MKMALCSFRSLLQSIYRLNCLQQNGCKERKILYEMVYRKPYSTFIEVIEQDPRSAEVLVNLSKQKLSPVHIFLIPAIFSRDVHHCSVDREILYHMVLNSYKQHIRLTTRSGSEMRRRNGVFEFSNRIGKRNRKSACNEYVRQFAGSFDRVSGAISS